eukprot:s3702_g4.t1
MVNKSDHVPIPWYNVAFYCITGLRIPFDEVSLGAVIVFLREGKTEEVSVEEGQEVALYFSAHWCPPCRRSPAIGAAEADGLWGLQVRTLEDAVSFVATFVVKSGKKW